MIIYSLIILAILASILFALIYQFIKTAKEQGRIERELKEEQLQNDIKNEHGKIASRPNASANVLLRRMRRDDISD